MNKCKELLREEITIKYELFRCALQWKERIGINTAYSWAEGEDVIKETQDQIRDQLVANFAHIYPWFSNMQTHFAVVHNKYLSIFDINS